MRSLLTVPPNAAGLARRLTPALLAFTLLATGALPAAAQDPRPEDPDYVEPSAPVLGSHFGSSPFDPPEENDQTFVVD